MVGFWSPFFIFINRALSAWWHVILESAPLGGARFLKLTEDPIEVSIDHSSDITASFSSVPVNRDINVVLGSALTITKNCIVPEGALGEAKKVAWLEAARVMPLEIDSLIISLHEQPLSANERKCFEIISARKSVIDAVFKAARLRGLRIHNVFARRSERDTLTKFQLWETEKPKLSRGITIVLICLTVFYVLTLLPSVYEARLNSEILELDAAVRETRKKTEAIAGLQRQVQSLEELSIAVEGASYQSNILELISSLTAASPDDLYFTEFRLEGRQAYVSGYAKAPETWVLSLERNDAFQNVLLTSVLDDAEQSKRKFDVRFEVIWPEERKGGAS